MGGRGFPNNHSMYITESRSKSFVIILIVYLLATAGGILTYLLAAPEMQALWALLLADVVATVITWAAGMLYRNVSVYDPYWSVAPPVLLTLYVLTLNSWNFFHLSNMLLLLSVWVWAIRLTGNWAVTFRGLRHEDWRYSKYRTEQPRWIFEIINFFGLNMMPTLVVFLAMTPAVRILEEAPAAGVQSWIGALLCLAAAAIQYVADTTSHRWRREHPGEICKQGLWKRGRHPNYFGEILMWWGVWVQGLGTAETWMIAGPLSITALFLCISIPLMESRQMKNKPGYAQYRKETRILI